MSTTVAAGRQLAISARVAAWAGIVLGILAAYVALPPLMIRTPAVSLVLAAVGIAAGVYATRRGQKRLGWIAVAIAVLGAILGGKKGAAIGALSGAGGSALYTYKLRNRNKRY